MEGISGFTPLRGAVAALSAAVVLAGGYSIHEHNSAQKLSAENTQMTTALKDTRGQLDTLASKVNAMSEAEAQRQQAAAATQRARVTHTATTRRPNGVTDKRWKEIQAKLDAQRQAIDANGKAIEDTRSDLTSAKTELSGSIARTHDELVVLQRKGERSYFEFDVDKSKQFRATGPVGIKLKKANLKHQFADMDLMVDDVALNQKHVNLLQPVIFYAGENGKPVELVVQRISHNHIHGYVSTPKYKDSDLAAMASANAQTNGAQANSEQGAPARQRLDLPKN
jgi:outer membrane murein-binding lipoprotein Lpp